MSSSQPQSRRVFFSFHFQNDIWRVNQVRQSWRYKCPLSYRHANGNLDFFDASIWEDAKRKGENSMKQLIRENLKNTTVTCILVGENTYQRPWVQYEIARSIVKGNALLVVYINKLMNQKRMVSRAGPNPLNYMGVCSDKGRIVLAKKSSNGWIPYDKHTTQIILPKKWQTPSTDHVIALSTYVPKIYCYDSNNGKHNFINWVHAAANSLV